MEGAEGRGADGTNTKGGEGMTTLLDKAKSRKLIKPPIESTAEECELVLAWLNGEISRSAASSVLHTTDSVGVYKLTNIIRYMYKIGVLVRGKEIS